MVLLSGGVDSSTLLYSLHQKAWECYPLTVDYGQRHRRELLAALDVCSRLGLGDRYKCLDLRSLSSLIHSALHGFGEIPEGHYTDKSQEATISPNRNMILLSIAAGYAQTLRATNVAYAAHSNDRTIYPDCRPEFIRSVGETIELGTGGAVELKESFTDFTKAGIVKLGIVLGVPYELTWSCYVGGDRPCLRCGTCLERIEAFQLAGSPDPLLSSFEWSLGLSFLEEFSKGDKE